MELYVPNEEAWNAAGCTFYVITMGVMQWCAWLDRLSETLAWPLLKLRDESPDQFKVEKHRR